MPIKTFTIETDSPESYVKMMKSVKSQTMRLVNYGVILNLQAPYTPYNSLSLEIGNITSGDFVIDNDVGRYYLKIQLNTFDIGIDNIQRTFVGNSNIPLTMSSDLDQSFWFRVRDRNGAVLPIAVLSNIFLQFELSE